MRILTWKYNLLFLPNSWINLHLTDAKVISIYLYTKLIRLYYVNSISWFDMFPKVEWASGNKLVSTILHRSCLGVEKDPIILHVFLDLVQRLYLHNAHVLTVEYLTKAISAFQFTWYLMDQASRIVRMWQMQKQFSQATQHFSLWFVSTLWTKPRNIMI